MQIVPNVANLHELLKHTIWKKNKQKKHILKCRRQKILPGVLSVKAVLFLNYIN